MKNAIYPLLTILILLTSATVVLTPTNYTVGSGYKIDFKSKDPSGSFNEMSGDVSFDAKDLTNSKMNFTFKVSSINTGNAMQNKKAQTEEWFHASKFPDIKFVSTKIVEKNGSYTVIGNLTIKGTSKEYKVPMKTESSSNGITLKGTFTVNRLDFKVGKKSETVPDGMKVTYSIPLTKK